MPPRTSDPLSALLAHNLWATRLILEKCRALAPEQFQRPFPIGPGDHAGLHSILTHIIGAMRRWADRIAAAAAGNESRTIRPPIESWRPGYQPRPPYTPDELLTLLDEAHRDLASTITPILAAPRSSQGQTDQPALERPVVFRFPSPEGATSHTFTTGAAIASATVHGHYHRAQCMNILRQLNIPPASIDVIDWQLAEEPDA